MVTTPCRTRWHAPRPTGTSTPAPSSASSSARTPPSSPSPPWARCPRAPRRSAPSTTPIPAPCRTTRWTPCPPLEAPIMTRKAEPQDPLAPVRTLLERLNLTTAARCLPYLLAQAEATQPAYSAFLHQLLEAEQGSRWERKLQRRRRWSKLGPPLSLEGFDWAARPQLSPRSSTNCSPAASSTSTAT